MWAIIAGIAASIFGGSIFLAPYGGAGDGSGSLSIDGLTFPPSVKMAGVQQLVTGGGTRTKYGVAGIRGGAVHRLGGRKSP